MAYAICPRDCLFVLKMFREKLVKVPTEVQSMGIIMALIEALLKQAVFYAVMYADHNP